MTTPHLGTYSVRAITANRTSSSWSSSNRTIEVTNNTFVVTSSSDNNESTCATFQETEGSWECQTEQGVDPAMMLCFVGAIDALRATRKNRMGSTINLGSMKSIASLGSRRSLVASSHCTRSTSSKRGRFWSSDRSKSHHSAGVDITTKKSPAASQSPTSSSPLPSETLPNDQSTTKSARSLVTTTKVALEESIPLSSDKSKLDSVEEGTTKLPSSTKSPSSGVLVKARLRRSEAWLESPPTTENARAA